MCSVDCSVSVTSSAGLGLEGWCSRVVDGWMDLSINEFDDKAPTSIGIEVLDEMYDCR